MKIFSRLTHGVLLETDPPLRDLRNLPLPGAQLAGQDLQGAILSGANLGGADLRWANLTGSTAVSVNLDGANLKAANLTNTDLRDASLRDADLRMANLNCARLVGANLSGADLRWANLNGADLHWANIEKANLAEADGLTARVSALRIAGSRDPIWCISEENIAVGRQQGILAWWIENIQRICACRHYSWSETEEYVAHIGYCAAWLAARKGAA